MAKKPLPAAQLLDEAWGETCERLIRLDKIVKQRRRAQRRAV